jgi:molybdopterin-guanine dinucleotide biosynthesis protein A
MVPAVILAGGMSRRMGRDKLALPIGNLTLLESAVIRFEEEFDDVYISVAEISKYPEVTTRRIVDVLPGAGPLSGLHAALSALPGNGIFLSAADLPYACPRAAKRIIELSGDHEICIIKLPDGNLEPLFAFYRDSILPQCFEAINSGDNKIANIIYGANTRFVTIDELGELWDEKIILNINYPEDYEKI